MASLFSWEDCGAVMAYQDTVLLEQLKKTFKYNINDSGILLEDVLSTDEVKELGIDAYQLSFEIAKRIIIDGEISFIYEEYGLDKKYSSVFSLQPKQVKTLFIGLLGISEKYEGLDRKKHEAEAAIVLPVEISKATDDTVLVHLKYLPEISRVFINPHPKSELSCIGSERLNDFLNQNSIEKRSGTYHQEDLVNYLRKMIEFVKAEIGFYQEDISVTSFAIQHMRNYVNPEVFIGHLRRLNYSIEVNGPNLLLKNIVQNVGLKKPALHHQESRHLGQMTGSFPLSSSQRYAIKHASLLTLGELIAIKGPPGTGKTTFLQTVLADQVVKLTLDTRGELSPVFVACAPTNQAGKNLSESFESALPIDQLGIEKRLFSCTGMTTPYFTDFQEFVRSLGIKLNQQKGRDFILDVIANASKSENVASLQETYIENLVHLFGVESISISEAKKHFLTQLEGLANLEKNLNKLLESQESLVDIESELDKFDRKALRSLSTTNESRLKSIKAYKLKTDKNESSLNTVLEQLVGSKFERSVQAILLKADELFPLYMGDGGVFDSIAIVIKLKNSDTFLLQLERFLEDLNSHIEKEASLSTFFKALKFSSSGKYKQSIQVERMDRDKTLLLIKEDFEQRVKGLIAIYKKKMVTLERMKEKRNEALVEYENSKEMELTEQKRLDSLKDARQERINAYTEIKYQVEDMSAKPIFKGSREILDKVISFKEKISTRTLQSVLLDKAEIDTFLDTVVRYSMFNISLRVQEIVFLERLKTVRASGHIFGTEQRLKLFMRLFPCLITTFNSLPKVMKKQTGEKGEWMVDFADFLLVDEAGQALNYLALPNFMFAKKAIIVGDRLQITPVYPSDYDGEYDKFCAKDSAFFDKIVGSGLANHSYQGVEQSLMSFAENACLLNSLGEGVLLKDHRRCVDEIIGFSNRYVYQGELNRCRGEFASLYPGLNNMSPLTFIETEGFSETQGDSRINRKEAELIASWLSENIHLIMDGLDKKIEDLDSTIGVVTPFKAQSDLIRSRFAELDIPFVDQITVDTIHAFQGGEREVMIFSSVYGQGDDGMSFINHSPNLLNVAITRAKGMFIVFGNKQVYQKTEGLISGELYKYIEEFK